VLALVAALIVAGALIWGARAIVRESRASRAERAHERTLRILALFAPGVDAAAADPRALLTWQPLAAAARKTFPEEFAALDRASGAPFPFSKERLQAAHARWTAEWLAWERSHDGEYKLKVAAAEGDLQAAGGSAIARARLDGIEREKLELYQRRYEEYVRVARALQALVE
jgi:hypothetical protein